jgi:monofunctional glycosyltransferase
MSKSTRVVLAVVLALVLAAGAGLALILNSFINPPDFSGMKSVVTQNILLADGSKSTRQVGPKGPGWVPVSQISNHLLMAVIASEDSSFYSHKGVDYYELKQSIKKDLEEKKWARGGSTLTEQVVKNIFLSPEKSVWRKIKEFIWAQQLEKVLTKSQILCFYVNMAEWAPGIYGIGAASAHYFSVAPSELTPKQSAFLAMLLPGPRKYHIYFLHRQLTRWSARRVNQILHVMNSMSYIDDEEFEQAKHESLWGEVPFLDDSDADVTPGSDDSELPSIDNLPVPDISTHLPGTLKEEAPDAPSDNSGSNSSTTVSPPREGNSSEDNEELPADDAVQDPLSPPDSPSKE